MVKKVMTNGVCCMLEQVNNGDCQNEIRAHQVKLIPWREPSEYLREHLVYDKVCREVLWRLLRECGVDGYLIRSMSSLYNESRACVRLGSKVGKYFELRKGLKQGCIISPWLFNIFSDRVVG